MSIERRLDAAVHINRVAERRRAIGLSQAELAAATGLSRQLVSAVENRRHAPSVKAAIAIARALEAHVEELFGDSDLPSDFVPVLGEEPAGSAGVLTVKVGGSICYHPVPDAGPSWIKADGIYRNGRVELFEDADPSGIGVAGCDPALGLAAAMLPGGGPRRAVAIPAASGAAVRALDEGRVHAALVHGRPGDLRSSNRPARRFLLARWRVGLACRIGTRIDLDRIVRGEETMTLRSPEAEATRALERNVGKSAMSGIRGPLVATHIDAARRVSYGAVDVALTMEAAARAFELDFVELEAHVAELQLAEQWADLPGTRALLEVIRSAAFRERLEAVGGYDLKEAGEEV